MRDPWQFCPCGHLWLLHDVEDLNGTNPTCCVDGCDQEGCRDRDRALVEAIEARDAECWKFGCTLHLSDRPTS